MDVTEDHEFANTEVQLLAPVDVIACKSGFKPCNLGHAESGCVRADLKESKLKSACENIKKERLKYNIPCKVFSQDSEVNIGYTRSDSDCSAIREAWEEVWQDPVLSEKYKDPSTRRGIFVNILMAPESKKDNPGISTKVTTNKSGKVFKTSKKSDALLKRIYSNLEKMRGDLDCGVGIIPGMDKVPVLNQKSQGTCYAHTSTTLIDFVRLHQNGRIKSYGSPLMGAIDYQLLNTDDIESCKDPLAGGFPCKTFNESIKRGFCDSQEIEKAIIRGFRKPDDFKSAKYYLEKQKKAWSSISNESFPINPNDEVLSFLWVIGQGYESKKWDKLQDLWFSLKKNSNKDACVENKNSLLFQAAWLKVMTSSSLESFYTNFFDGVCHREPLPRNISCSEIKGPFNTTSIDQTLEGGYPIGITYCSTILLKKDFGIKDNKWGSQDCGLHASVIIGTARDKFNRCTYVVRNSWGTGCGYYDKDYECRDGNIYIPKESLLKNIRDITKVYEQ